MGLFSSLGNLFSGGGGTGTLGSVMGPIGGIADTVTNILTANSASSKSKREAERNRAWLTEMSNTAHQRAVKDLNAAGLNEILAMGGQGATTPSSALASASQPGTSGIGSGINSALNYSTNKQIADAQSKIADSTESLNNTKSAEIEKRTGLIEPETNAKIKTMNSETRKNEAQTENLKSEKNKIVAETELKQAETEKTKALTDQAVTFTNVMKGKNIKAYLAGKGISATESTITKIKNKIVEIWETTPQPEKEFKSAEELYDYIIKSAKE